MLRVVKYQNHLPVLFLFKFIQFNETSQKPVAIYMLNNLHLFFRWLQECPTGLVNEETFKEIYAQFFPQGGKCFDLTSQPVTDQTPSEP